MRKFNFSLAFETEFFSRKNGHITRPGPASLPILRPLKTDYKAIEGWNKESLRSFIAQKFFVFMKKDDGSN